jgi:hypothetical protein
MAKLGMIIAVPCMIVKKLGMIIISLGMIVKC